MTCHTGRSQAWQSSIQPPNTDVLSLDQLAREQIVPISYSRPPPALPWIGDAFNITNHFNWGQPNSNLLSSTFGRILSMSGDPRILQFGIKYGF